MQGLVTVFGGSGFVGSKVVRALARGGLRVRVAVRRPHLAYRMRLMGDVGQVQVVQANVNNRASVERALEGAAAAVNLVGLLAEGGGGQTFHKTMAEGAATVAEAARAAGVSALVQVSAIGADADSPSAYARAKAAGEAAVREQLGFAVILRPSIVFGPEDDFFNRFAAMAGMAPALPLIGGGKTRFQPVYVGDVAQAVLAGLRDPAAAGRTFELGGPGVYSFRELMELTLREIRRRRALLPIPFPVAGLMGAAGDLVGKLGLPAPVTSDQVVLLRSDNVVHDGADGLQALGVTPTALEPVLPTYLYRYRPGGQFSAEPAVPI